MVELRGLSTGKKLVFDIEKIDDVFPDSLEKDWEIISGREELADYFQKGIDAIDYGKIEGLENIDHSLLRPIKKEMYNRNIGNIHFNKE